MCILWKIKNKVELFLLKDLFFSLLHQYLIKAMLSMIFFMSILDQISWHSVYCIPFFCIGILHKNLNTYFFLIKVLLMTLLRFVKLKVFFSRTLSHSFRILCRFEEAVNIQPSSILRPNSAVDLGSVKQRSCLTNFLWPHICLFFIVLRIQFGHGTFIGW